MRCFTIFLHLLLVSMSATANVVTINSTIELTALREASDVYFQGEALSVAPVEVKGGDTVEFHVRFAPGQQIRITGDTLDVADLSTYKFHWLQFYMYSWDTPFDGSHEDATTISDQSFQLYTGSRPHLTLAVNAISSSLWGSPGMGRALTTESGDDILQYGESLTFDGLGGSFHVDSLGTHGDSYRFQLLGVVIAGDASSIGLQQSSSIPEPTNIALFAAGLFGLARSRTAFRRPSGFEEPHVTMLAKGSSVFTPCRDV